MAPRMTDAVPLTQSARLLLFPADVHWSRRTVRQSGCHADRDCRPNVCLLSLAQLPLLLGSMA